MTGIISAGAAAPGNEPGFGTVVAPGVYGPNHQHFFSIRLDMQVDGSRNSLYELEPVGLPVGPDNPHGNAWRQTARQLRTEADAQRMIEPLAARGVAGE